MSKSFIIMGVSGCGKSTVGETLASSLGLPFYDGDDFHPQANVDKMASGTPLNDGDRQPWLEKLASLITDSTEGCVIACSALKKRYRETLRTGGDVTFVFLEGSKALLLERLIQRSANTDHFMPASLLDSQLETLESPKGEANTLTLDISKPPEELQNQLLNSL